MIKAVFFDAIDTLFLANPDKIGAYIRFIEEKTGVTYNREQMSRAWVKIVAETEAAAKAVSETTGHAKMAWANFNANLLRELGFNGDCDVIGPKIQHESWDKPSNYQLYPDVLPILEELQKQKLYIACVSNEDGQLYTFFEHFKIKRYFQFVLTSSEVGFEKPNKRVFLTALERTTFSPDEVLFVGDSLISDYEGSKAVGMKPILIDRDGKNTDNNVVAINDLTKLLEYL